MAAVSGDARVVGTICLVSVRVHSTTETAAAGEITLLAMLETAVAVGISIWLAWHRHSLRHVEVGACLAPLLLLRTERSTELALRWMAGFMRLAKAERDRLDGLQLIAFLFTFALAGVPLVLVVVRGASIAVTVIQHPFLCLRELPSNWRRVVLATDFFCTPELIPGAEQHPLLKTLELVDWLRFNVWRSSIKERVTTHSTGGAMQVAVAVLIYLPAVLYRFSVKATSIIYLPLLFIIADHPSGNLRLQLRDLAFSEIEKLKRLYSAFVIFCLNIIPATVYFLLRAWWRELVAWAQDHIPQTAIRLPSLFLFTIPNGIELDGWHIARTVNSILTIGLWIFAKEKLNHMEEQPAIAADAPSKGIAAWLAVRRVLTVYIIGCTIYILVTTVDWRAIPPIHVRWLPWS